MNNEFVCLMCGQAMAIEPSFLRCLECESNAIRDRIKEWAVFKKRWDNQRKNSEIILLDRPAKNIVGERLRSLADIIEDKNEPK